MVKIQTKPFIKAQVICFLPGIIGGMATANAIETWYVFLNKPSFNPPNNVFGPVWSILYFLQGISLYLINTTPVANLGAKTIARVFFVFQLSFNLLWTISFFSLKSPQMALVVMGLLIISIIFTLIAAARINKTAAYLLIPYLIWVIYAAILNYQIVKLN